MGKDKEKAKELQRVNHRSDFSFILHVRDVNGTELGFPVGFDWEALFWTSSRANTFKASCRGGKCTNCCNDGGLVRVVADNHGLFIGRLHCEFTMEIPDRSYPDGSHRVVSRSLLDIELVKDPAEYAAAANTLEAAVHAGVFGARFLGGGEEERPREVEMELYIDGDGDLCARLSRQLDFEAGERLCLIRRGRKNGSKLRWHLHHNLGIVLISSQSAIRPEDNLSPLEGKVCVPPGVLDMTGGNGNGGQIGGGSLLGRSAQPKMAQSGNSGAQLGSGMPVTQAFSPIKNYVRWKEMPNGILRDDDIADEMGGYDQGNGGILALSEQGASEGSRISIGLPVQITRETFHPTHRQFWIKKTSGSRFKVSFPSNVASNPTHRVPFALAVYRPQDVVGYQILEVFPERISNVCYFSSCITCTTEVSHRWVKNDFGKFMEYHFISEDLRQWLEV